MIKLKTILILLVTAINFHNLFAQTMNEFLGTRALSRVTSGDYNVAIGDSASNNLTSTSGST